MRKTFVLVSLALSCIGLVPHAQAQGGPFSGGPSITTDQALAQAPRLDPSLVSLDKAFQSAQAKLKKLPKDAKVRTAYVNATYAYGHAVMIDQGKMSPKVQYRAALALYRRALAVNPNHKPSKDEKKQIEDIYVGMGMPIPK